MLGTAQKQSLVDFGLPCWLQLLAQVGHLAGATDPAADVGVLAAGPAAAAGLPLPVVAAGLGWPEAMVAAGVAADLLSWLLA